MSARNSRGRVRRVQIAQPGGTQHHSGEQLPQHHRETGPHRRRRQGTQDRWPTRSPPGSRSPSGAFPRAGRARPPPTGIGAPTGSAPHLAAGAVVVDDLVPSQTRPEPGTARQRGSRQHPDQPVAANRRCPAESFRAPPPPSPSPSTTFGAVPGGDRPPGPDRSPVTGTSAKSTSVMQIRCSDPRTTWVPVVNGPPVSGRGREGGGRVSGSGVDHIAGVSGSRSSVS